MDFGLSEEQEALQSLARQILSDRMTLQHLKELDASEDWFDRETWGELATANLLGIAVPEAHGGLGYGFLDLALLLVEQGRAVAPLPLLPTLVMGALPVARFGSDDQQGVLDRVVAGDAVLTAALNELGAEPDVPTTTATQDGDGWRIDGKKVCVPAAHLAEWILVPATVGDDVAIFLVPPATAGVTLERQATTSHEPQFVVGLDGVVVPGSAVLGSVAQGREILRWVLDRTIIGMCAISSGAAAEGLRITAEYTTTRKQFERAIGTFQAVGQRLADAYIDCQAMDLTMLLAASQLAEELPADLEVATAKFWASEGGHRVGHAGLHVHGGISIDVDYPIHRYFLWLKQVEFALGAARPQLSRIGKILAA
jgi:alkylation response protein AidB-like acyl-CoA dehydrogenase